jgi:ribosome maturation factor RimP
MSNRIENLVEELLIPMLQGTEIELIDVEYVKEREWYLRVFIDKTGGIDIEDCQLISEQLEGKLDELDPIQDNYYLEVSSPGLDRVLKKDKDLKRHLGDSVEVSTYAPIDGSKSIVGKLVNFTDTTLELDTTTILRENVAKIKLHLEF